MIQHLKRQKHNFFLAIWLITFADLSCAAQAIFVKLASPYFSTNALVFFRSAINLLLLFISIPLLKGLIGYRDLYKTKVLKYHLIRSFTGIGAIYCLYYSLVVMPIGPATLLYFTYPVFIPFVTRIWLRVALIHTLWWGIGLSFIGIIVVLNPRGDLFQLEAIIPLLGAVLGSISNVSIRVLHHYKEKTETIMVYYFSISVVMSGIVLMISKELLIAPASIYGFVMAALAGVAATIFQTLITTASKYASARFLSPFIYGIFIFSAVGEYFVFDKTPSIGTLLGFALIVIGTKVMILLYPKEDVSFVPKKKKQA